jgi:ABC-type sugar transport system ATPase subunit
VGITKRYGGVYALKGANFELRSGEVHALIGENGAGKSTLARILAGSTRADSGAISLHGAPVEIANPLDAQRLGIGIIYQELDLFPNLTAGENIVIGNLHFPEGRLVSFRRMEEFCRPFLRQVGLDCGIRQTAAAHARTDFRTQFADELLVYGSQLTPQGPVYTPTSRARLGE